jgi:Trk K+ transport system NAD-binding subunit
MADPMTKRRTPRERARRFLRVALAELRYMRRVWREFRWSLPFTLSVWALCTVILHEGYPIEGGEEPMEWDRAAYYVLVMTAFEAALDFHVDAPPLVKAVFFALPLLGLFVIIDAIVRFTKLVFERRTNKKEWQELLASTYKDHVIVCGLGHVGYRIVQQLMRSDAECVAIEQRESPFTAEIAALDVPVVAGDVRLPEVLLKAGIEHADAIIVATDNDIVNIETALAAKELAPQVKTIVRLFDQALAKKVEKLVEIDYAFSTSALAAPVFAAAAIARNVINSFVVEDQVLNTVEMVVREGSRLEGRTLGSVHDQMELTFLLLKEGDQADWNPRPDRIMRAGSKLLVVATVEIMRELEALNQGTRRAR